jgi:Ion transport protein
VTSTPAGHPLVETRDGESGLSSKHEAGGAEGGTEKLTAVELVLKLKESRKRTTRLSTASGVDSDDSTSDGDADPANGLTSAALKAVELASDTFAHNHQLHPNRTERFSEDQRLMVMEELYKLEKHDLRQITVRSIKTSQPLTTRSSLDGADDAGSTAGDSARSPSFMRGLKLPPPRLPTQATLKRILNTVADYARSATAAVAMAQREIDKADAWRWLPWMKLVRTRLYALMNAPESSPAAAVVNAVIVATIVMSTTALCLETMPEFYTEHAQNIFYKVEVASVAVFTADYGIRLLCCPSLPRFITGPFNLVDLVCVVPFYAQLGMDTGGSAGATRVARVLRMVRILRILKLTRRFERLKMVGNALLQSADMLVLLLFLVLLCLVIFGTAIHYAEFGDEAPGLGFTTRSPWDQACTMLDVVTHQPVSTALEVPLLNVTRSCKPLPTPFDSIPRSFYWCITTLLTVGYGDTEPITPVGRFVGALCMVAGVLLLSLPVSVIGTEFTQQYLQFKATQGVRVIERRRRAPRFAALRRRMGAHGVLMDDILLRVRDVLFEIDDLCTRLHNKHARRKLELEAQRSSARRLRQRHHTSVITLVSAQREVKHDTDMLVLELELRHKLVKLADLVAQAELLTDPTFLSAIEHCRQTYVSLQEHATSMASLTEEADDTEQAMEDALVADARRAEPELWPDHNTTWMGALSRSAGAPQRPSLDKASARISAGDVEAGR